MLIPKGAIAGMFSSLLLGFSALIAPALTINTVVILISSFKLYDRVLALTGGGPGRSTETISMLIIRTAFNENRVGFASSMSLVLLILSGITTFVALIYLGKREVTT